MTKIGGLIAFYKLQEWWLSSFTFDEREYIDSCYQTTGGSPHALTQGTILERQQPAPEFLNGLNTWFRSDKDSSIAEISLIPLPDFSSSTTHASALACAC